MMLRADAALDKMRWRRDVAGSMDVNASQPLSFENVPFFI